MVSEWVRIRGSATILVATLLQLSFRAVSFPWYIYKKQEDGDMSPSSLVCCWTWGVRPLFCCASSSIHHKPSGQTHPCPGCALYRSIVEVEYRRTSIYTQDVKKKPNGVTVVYFERDQRPIHAGPEKVIHYFKSWSVSELLILFITATFLLFCLNVFFGLRLFFPSNHFSLDPSLLVGRCVPLYVIGSIRTRHTCLFCLWDISDNCISLVARRAVKVFFWVLHE